MPSKSRIPDALIVSGDDRIRKLLAQAGAVVTPAASCIPDGFVIDTTTPYTNPSIYRPPSVCRARLVSRLDYLKRPVRGNFHFGFTMYTSAGHDEEIEMWIGHLQVARARIPDPDNRVHLFLVPERFAFRGGEQIRLVTSQNDGPCRMEHLVFLPRRPQPTPPALEILSPHADARHADGEVRAYITWITNRPASGEVRWGSGGRLAKRVRISEPLANHEVVLENLDLGKRYRYEIRMADRTGNLEALYSGQFATDFSPPKSRTKTGRIPIRLRRPACGDTPWPVSVGVPFPKGALGSPDEVRLMGRDGAEAPAQAEALARWDDGSVQWALVDFQADGRQDYTVDYGSAVSRQTPADALRVAQSRAGIEVTTGPIRVAFPRDRAVFPGIVSLRQDDGTYRRITAAEPGAASMLIADDGTACETGRPDAVVVETSGPERACVRIDLTHRGAGGESRFRSTFRVHLFRNSGAMRVLHTFENDRTDEEFTRIRELSLRADLSVGAGVEGRIGRRRIGALDGQAAMLRQTHDNRYAVTRGRQTLGRGKRADGTADLSGDAVGVTVAVRDFWQNYPKGLGVDRDGIAIQVCPPLGKGDYPRGGEMEDRLYYYLLDGRYKLKCGVSRTHEIWFSVRAGGAAPPDFNACVQRPPLYSVPLSAFNRSRSVIQLPSKEKPPFPLYEAWVEAAREAYPASREMFRAYGMLNYGDWFGERTYNWGNMEYDTPWCFLQEYVRGGHPDFYVWAEEAAHHLVDVDTCHHHDRPNMVGGQYSHCVGHVGGYYPRGYREQAIYDGHWSPSHTWVEGLFLYHLLSGDARALEGAMKTCDLLVGEMLNNYDFTTCRNSGWHLIHLAAAYRATGRHVYLNGARIIAERVLERQRPSGGWDRMMAGGHCLCDPPRHMGNAGFMAGILLAGLERYYQATGDRRVRGAIVRAADFLINSMWEPGESAFHYTSCPASHVVSGADMRILRGVAMAYRFTGEARFKEVLIAGIHSALTARRPRAGRGVGKGIGSPMRGTPQVLMDLPGEAGG